MSLKRLLSASLLLAALAASAAAQGKPVEFRQGDAFKGPVQSARLETARYSRVDGVMVEGPRRLVAVDTYTPDGKRKEQVSYAPDGSVSRRYVHVYDDAGNEIELSVFDRKGDLHMRKVYRPEARETLTYNGDGSLRERRVVTLRPDGTQAEYRTYGGDGALQERSVNVKEGGVSVWSTYGPDGALKKDARHSLNYGGAHHTELQTYAPDGAVVGRRVADSDARATDLRATEDRGDGGPPRQTRQTREYDSRRNLSKLVRLRWNAETGVYEPSAVTYYTITYYR
jgi:hypothetical protein